MFLVNEINFIFIRFRHSNNKFFTIFINYFIV